MPSFSGVKASNYSTLENEGITFFRNIGKKKRSDTAPHTSRHEYLMALVAVGQTTEVSAKCSVEQRHQIRVHPLEALQEAKNAQNPRRYQSVPAK